MQGHRKSRFSHGILVAVLAAVPAAGVAAEPVTPDLTSKLDRLLRQEMAAVEEAMQAIFAAIVSGDHGAVAEKAQQVHDSFILDQNLTPADRKDLKAAVPQAFLKLDQAFHADAAELAEAGRAEDADRQLELFQSMSRACVTCHRRYVGDRFPGLR